MTVREQGPRTEVALRGEIDLANVEAISMEVLDVMANDAMVLVLDVSEVTYLDSTGVRLLFRLARQLRERQQRLVLVVPEQALIRSVLTLSGVTHVMGMEPTLAEARAAVDAVIRTEL